MAQYLNPFTGKPLGWDDGENGWGQPLNSTLIQYAFYLNRNVKGILASPNLLPTSPNDGDAYLVVSNARVYYYSKQWYNDIPPEGMKFRLTTTGKYFTKQGANFVQDEEFANVAYSGNAGDLTGKLSYNVIPEFIGDVTKPENSAQLTLANSGVVAGSYGLTTGLSFPRFTVDTKGRITSVVNQLIPNATTTVSGLMSGEDKTKLDGLAVQVNSDWNSVSGFSQILNKPTLGTAAALNAQDNITDPTPNRLMRVGAGGLLGNTADSATTGEFTATRFFRATSSDPSIPTALNYHGLHINHNGENQAARLLVSDTNSGLSSLQSVGFQSRSSTGTWSDIAWAYTTANTSPSVQNLLAAADKDGIAAAVGSEIVYDTVAQSALASLPVGTKYSTKGCLSIGDGGHGDFIVETASGTPDGYSRVLLANGNHGVLQPVNGEYSALQFGVVADGVTDDTVAFKRALGFLSEIDMHGRAVALTNAELGTLFTIGNKTIKNAVFNITVPSTTYSRTFMSLGNLYFYGCTFNYTVPTGGQVTFMTPATGDIIEKCKINGGVYNNAGTESHLFYYQQCLGAGEQNNVKTIDTEIDSVSFVHLKTVSSTSTQKGWRFIGCVLSNIYREGVGINSPMGVVEDFIIRDCRFLSHNGLLFGQYGLYIAIATGDGITVDNCWFEGSVSQCIHIEEAVTNFTVTKNKGHVDCKGGVIGLLENDLVGVMHWPERGIISQNVFTKAGTVREAGSVGLFLVNNASVWPPADNITITDNIFDGFERPFSLATDVNRRGIVRGNHAINGVDGFYLSNSFGSLDGNYSTNCVNGVVSVGGAKMVTNHTFKNCGNLFSGAYIADTFKVIFDSYDAVAGDSVSKPLFTTSVNQRHNVTYTTMINRGLSQTHMSIKTGTFTFDGTNSGGSVLNTIEPGGINSFYELSGGVVRLRVFSGASGILSSTVKVNGVVSNI